VGNRTTSRTIALVAAGGVVLGSIGPWGSTPFGDVAGTDGDGVITLVLGIAAAIVVFTRPSGSRWLWAGLVLGAFCAIIGIVDIADLSSEESEFFGEKVDLVSPGWGIWLMTISSLVLAAGSGWLYVEGEPSASPEPPTSPPPTG
jgi:hypothetical protein